MNQYRLHLFFYTISVTSMSTFSSPVSPVPWWIYRYFFHSMGLSPNVHKNKWWCEPHLPTQSLTTGEARLLDTNTNLVRVIAVLTQFPGKLTCCWFCSVFLQHIIQIIVSSGLNLFEAPSWYPHPFSSPTKCTQVLRRRQYNKWVYLFPR